MGNALLQGKRNRSKLKTQERETAMKIVRLAGAYHVARIVPKPKNDKTATEYVFSIPYRRVRQDSLGQYVLVNGKCIPVALCNVQN